MADATFKDFVVDQLRGMEGVACRGMFGGFGLYQSGRFFGIIHKGELYFKVGPKTVGRYIAMGSSPFRPSKKQTLKSYYEVPAEVIENRELLVEFARAAARSGAAKR